MQKWILYNWAVIAITALLVGVYISIFEDFVKDKGYLYFIIALLFGAIFYFQRKKA